MRKYIKKINRVSIIVLAVVFTLGLGGIIVVRAVTPPDRGLGLADSYSVFGKAGITTTGVTNVWGNAGADSSVGLDDATQVDGSVYTGAGVAGVETDARSTYDSLMSALQGTPAGAVTGLNLAGTHTTLNGNAIVPGVYTIGATTMNGAFELSGAGVYIFRSDSSATIAATSAAHMTLTNGACASNVFWAIPASMTIGTYAHIEGTIIASTGAITIATGATLVGRAISLISQVTLDANQITVPTCSSLPYLTVIKEVAGGGPKGANDFPLFIDTELTTNGTAVEVSAGAHIVTETTDSNYTRTFSDSCPGGNISLSSGINKTCTITNTYAPPATHLIVIKHVVNDNSGAALASAFSTTITDVTTATPTSAGVESPGVDNILTSVGAYSIDEGEHIGYDKTLSTDCSGTIALGQTKTCTITNNDIDPKLHLRKIINGGTATVADFPLTANGTGANDISGTSPVDSGAGLLADTFALSETNPGGYTASVWVCVGGSQSGSNITLAINEEATCTITNTRRQSSSGSIPRVVVPVFEPTITILSTPVVVAPTIPNLPKTGFPPQESSTWYESLLNNILNLLDKNIK